MSNRPGYKTTEIGEIPQNWQAVRLNEVCKIKRGASPRPIGDPSYFSGQGRGWIRIVDVTSTYKYLRKTAQYLSEKGESRSVRVDPGDLIMSICATIGKPVILDMEACIHDGFVWFSELAPSVDTEYLFYVLQHKEKDFVGKKQTGTQGNLNTTIVGKTMVPVPPLPEQQKIASILSTVDEAIQKTDEIIAKTQQLKKGLMQQLLTKGIGHTRFKQTEIGEIPEEWEVARLEDIIRMGSGEYFRYDEFVHEGVKVLKIDNVGFGKVVWETTTYLPETHLMKYSDLILREGDMVLALNRPIIDGKVKIAMLSSEDAPSLLYQRVGKVIIRDHSALEKNYLFHLMGCPNFRNRMSRLCVGTDQPYINPTTLVKMQVPLPPLDEQREIADILSDIDRKIENEEMRKDQVERMKKGLMQVLLTGKVRVKVS